MVEFRYLSSNNQMYKLFGCNLVPQEQSQTNIDNDPVVDNHDGNIMIVDNNIMEMSDLWAQKQ